MRIVFSRCASEGTAVIFTCLPIWGFAISWFSICMSLPLSPTNTACPLFVVQPGSQVLRSLTFVTHCASQMVPVIFICLSAADSSAAEHRTPTNSHALRFIHASYASSLRTPSHTRGSRIWVGNCFADGVHYLLLGPVNRVPDPKRTPALTVLVGIPVLGHQVPHTIYPPRDPCLVVQCSKGGSHLAGRRPAPALRIHLHHVVESSRKDDLRLLLHIRGGVVNHKISALDHIHHIAIGNRLHPGYHASWRQRRIGGVVGDIHHRQAAGGGIAARYGANVELVIGGERHRGVQTIGDRHRVRGVARQVADVHRIEGWASGVGCPGHIQGAVVHQAYTGASNRYRGRDGRGDGRGWNVELRH